MKRTQRGLILRVTPYKDSDRLLTILLEDGRKLTANARGAERRGSSLAAACQFLRFGSFETFTYRDKTTVDEAAVELSFEGVEKDLLKLSLAVYLCEMLERLSDADVPGSDLLKLGLHTLYTLSETDRPPELMKAVFEWRAAAVGGFEPNLASCIGCGEEKASGYLSVRGGDFLCEDCARSGRGTDFGAAEPLAPGVLRAIRHAISSNFKKLFSFSLKDRSLETFCRVGESYLVDKLDYYPKSLRFYHGMAGRPDMKPPDGKKEVPEDKSPESASDGQEKAPDLN